MITRNIIFLMKLLLNRKWKSHVTHIQKYIGIYICMHYFYLSYTHANHYICNIIFLNKQKIYIF